MKTLIFRRISMRSPKQLFQILSLLLIAALTAVIFFIHRIHDKSKQISENWLPSVMHVGNLNTLTSDFRIMELQHILSTSDDQMRTYESAMQRIADLINSEMKLYEPLITTSVEKTLYEDFLNRWSEYMKHHIDMLQLSKLNKNEDAKQLIRARSEVLFNEYSSALSALVHENRRAADDEVKRANALYIGSVINLILILGCVAVFVVISLRQMRKIFDRVLSTAMDVVAKERDGKSI